MYSEKRIKKVVKAYREAAMRLFKCSAVEAEVYIRAPENDPGQWSPNALGIIYLEADGRKEGDEMLIPAHLDYYSSYGFNNCIKLSEEAGVGFIEHINAAVAAIWD